MIFIDAPRQVGRQTYDRLIAEMVTRLSGHEGLCSIYQIGHVSTPGVSDIDLVTVFSDDASCGFNPRAELSEDGLYLFAHNLYGVRRRDFLVGQEFSYFHNYTHLWGERLHTPPVAQPGDTVVLKRQVALEYLFMAYISMTVQRIYGITKLRSLLLQAKALLYDCEFLSIHSGPFVEAIQGIVQVRERWFDSPSPPAELRAKCERLYLELARVLGQVTQEYPLFLLSRPPYTLSRNIQVTAGGSLGFQHSGITLPSRLAFLGKKYFNLNHRFNRFSFHLPITAESAPDSIRNQFNWRLQMERTNREHFPHFMALCSSLSLS
jgi:hypothetical protein